MQQAGGDAQKVTARGDVFAHIIVTHPNGGRTDTVSVPKTAEAGR